MAVPIVHRAVRDAAIRQQGNSAFTRDVLAHLMPDTVKFEHDFVGIDVIPASLLLFTDGVGGTAPAVPATRTIDGVIDFVTGATDDGYSAMATGLEWRADRACVSMFILRASAITGLKIECGFTDATGTDGSTATDNGAILALATPTANATDCALWIFDTDDTGNVAWQAVGVKNGATPVKVEPTSIGNVDGDAAPNADKYDVLIVALREADARYYRGDMVDVDGNDNEKRLTITYDSGWQADHITSSVLLTPWVYCQTRAGAASRTVKLDYMKVYQNRYAEEI